MNQKRIGEISSILDDITKDHLSDDVFGNLRKSDDWPNLSTQLPYVKVAWSYYYDVGEDIATMVLNYYHTGLFQVTGQRIKFDVTKKIKRKDYGDPFINFLVDLHAEPFHEYRKRRASDVVLEEERACDILLQVILNIPNEISEEISEN